jgi:hypothetical protein
MSSADITPVRGILRRPSMGKASASPNERGLGSPTTRPGVHFEPPDDLEDLLKRAADQTLGRDQLEGLLTHLRNQKGSALVSWLQKIQENLSILKPSLESFVLAILNIGWADQERPVVVAYKHFLVNLISAQSYYTKPVVRMLMGNLVGAKNKQDSRVLLKCFSNKTCQLLSVK